MPKPIQSVSQRRALPERAVLIGARGMVGRSWVGLLASHGIEVRALARPEIDLLDPSTMQAAVCDGDRLVINAAAWTDVDGAETDEHSATRCNAKSVGALADRCAAVGATLIHYSTDYVFPGHASEPYRPDAPIDPINAYGRSKAAGEQSLRDTHSDHLLLRTSWVYAPWGKNFVRTIAGLAATRDELRVVDDQRGRPTSAEELARTSLALYLAGAAGTWHATDAGECTWHGLAREIVEALGLSCTMHACTTDEYPRPAARPAYSTLDLSATESLIGARTPWQVAVRRVIDRLER